jgi:Ca2+-binding RTX toxin-like protein
MRGYDALEGRKLLAVTATPSGGILYVAGDSGNNTISIEWTPGPSGRTIKVFDGSTVVATYNHVIVGPNLFYAVSVTGGAGNDTLYASKLSSSDTFADYPVTLKGDGGYDTLYGSDSAETIYGGPQSDDIYGYAGNDLIYGEGGLEVIAAGDGNDTVFGGNDADTIFGGSGSDKLQGDAGADYLSSFDGIAGNDTLYYDASDLLDFDGGDVLNNGVL